MPGQAFSFQPAVLRIMGHNDRALQQFGFLDATIPGSTLSGSSSSIERETDKSISVGPELFRYVALCEQTSQTRTNTAQLHTHMPLALVFRHVAGASKQVYVPG